MRGHIDLPPHLEKVVLAAGGVFTAFDERGLHLLDLAGDAFLGNFQLLFAPGGESILPLLRLRIQLTQRAAVDGLQLAHELFVLGLDQRQPLNLHHVAGEVAVVRYFFLAIGQDGVDLDLERFQPPQPRFDLAELRRFEFELALQAALADKRHAVVVAGALGDAVAEHETVRQNGGGMLLQILQPFHAHDLAEQGIDQRASDRVAGLDFFRQRPFQHLARELCRARWMHE